MNRPRIALTTVLALATLTASAAGAATPRKHVTVVSKKVTGPLEQADQWGYVQVALTIRKTTTVVGTRKTIARKIVGVTVPTYPNHTNRSVYISQQALPYLIQETLHAQSTNIQLVSGATNTSEAFGFSLQAAIAQAKSV
jgi:uncharacterized protein with FMN-binding domain